MKIFIDSADLGKIRRGFEIFPLEGVTTNPTIIARDIQDDDVRSLLEEIRKISHEKLMFVQSNGDTCDELVGGAIKINELLGGKISIKIPMGIEGVKAIKVLKKEGISTTATAVYTVTQALFAANAGADFVAPYISHIDNLCLDGPIEAGRMAQALKNQGFNTEVLAASFRTLSQVSRCFEAGVTSATVTYEMLEQAVKHPGTENEIEAFNKNWFGRFPENIGNLL